MRTRNRRKRGPSPRGPHAFGGAIDKCRGLADRRADSGNAIALQALRHAHAVKTWTRDGSTLELQKVDKSGATEDRPLCGRTVMATGTTATKAAKAIRQIMTTIS
jgi:hypothetical protein